MTISRRDILKTGPVLATLSAGPVASAGSINGCVVASSFVSVATFASRNPGRSATCVNQNVDTWRTAIANGVEVNGTVEQLLGKTQSSFNSSLLTEILSQPTKLEGELSVLQHLVSLTLSIQAGAVTGQVTIAYLQNVWLTYQTNHRTYTTTAGLQMMESQLIAWLRTLMGYYTL